MCARVRVLLLCGCLLLASLAYSVNAEASPEESSSQEVQPVHGSSQLPQGVFAIRSCLPFNLLVQLNQTGGSNGTFDIIGDPSVVSAIQVTFSNGVLALATVKDFRTYHGIQATVALPDPSSLLFVQNFASGDVVLGPGFTPPNFTASSTGIGKVIVNGLTTPSLRVISSGISTVAVNGSLQNVYAKVDGTSKVYLIGSVTGNVNLTMDGITTVFVQGSPSTVISGTVDNLAKVLYSDGQCKVTPAFQSLFGINIFGDPCNRVAASSAPTFTPVWTCGLLSRGQSDCSSPGSDSTLSNTQPSSPPLPGTPGVSTSPPPTGTPPPATPPVTGADVRTVTGPAGTVSTGTWTSGPGSSASAGGYVSRPGAQPLSIFQESVGGNTWPTTTATPVEESSNEESTFGSNWPPSTLLDVSIPNMASGLATVSLDCDQQPTNVPMLG